MFAAGVVRRSNFSNDNCLLSRCSEKNVNLPSDVSIKENEAL